MICKVSLLQHLCQTYNYILEYASTIWSPHLLCDINRIEMVQRQSARFVYNDFTRTSSVTSMLNNLGWPLLRQRRDVAKVTMFFKIINNLISISHGHISVSLAPTRGHNQKFMLKPMYICFLFSPW